MTDRSVHVRRRDSRAESNRLRRIFVCGCRGVMSTVDLVENEHD